MKNLLKLFSLFILLSLFVGTIVLAETNPTPTPATKTQATAAKSTQTAVILAEVNIRNAKIVSNEGKNYNISFLLTNGAGLQTGMKYGVSLVKQNKEGQYVMDEKIYDESITLNSNSKIEKNIVYTAPTYLDGDYSLLISVKNSNNFPFAFAGLGKVKLTATSKGVEILPETCSLTVVGEKGNPKYNLSQGVDIKSEESLSLSCSATNSSKADVSVVPTYITRFVSSFGDIATAIGGDVNPIVIKAGEKKQFSVVLPKPVASQIYNIEFSFDNKGVKSNSVNISYVLRGSKATIQSVSLDKDYYKRGETANAFFTYFHSVDTYLKGRYPIVAPTPIISKVKIENGKGRSCAKEQVKNLEGQLSTKVEVPTAIKSNCFNPKVIITLTDDKGNILDQKEFNIKTTSTKESKSNLIFIILVAILFAVIIYIYKKRKGTPPPSPIVGEVNDSTKISVPLSILFFIIISLYSFVPTHTINANTASVTNPSNPTLPISVAYDVGGERYENVSGIDYSYNGGTIGSYGSISCGVGPCSLYHISFYTDLAESYANNLKGEGADAILRGSLTWFNGSGYEYPLYTTGTQYLDKFKCDLITGICVGYGGLRDTTIPLSYDATPQGDQINIVWIVKYYDTGLSKSITIEDRLSKSVSIVYPQPMVTVHKESVGAINKGTSDKIWWTSVMDPSWVSKIWPVSCQCRTGGSSGPLCTKLGGAAASTSPNMTQNDAFVTPILNSNTTYYVSCVTNDI